VLFGAARLEAALAGISADPSLRVVAARADQPAVKALIEDGQLDTRATAGLAPEGFLLTGGRDGTVLVVGADDSGVLYGCLELADRVRAARAVPEPLHVVDAPAMKLRGPCIGMQKPYILPGRKVYEYPYTREEFPFFYDKAEWTTFLDFLVEHRMNTLYLWNGHPFASLVKVADYPEALEVSEEQFEENRAMFHFLTEEAEKRGIWVVQMFYNIILSKPFAEKHGMSTQLDAPNPLAADYTRKSIAEFVRQYPNVGLLVCLGEALQHVPMQRQWLTDVILPGVHDGMAAAGLSEEPPVVIRAHATDPRVIMPAGLEVYRNLYTMAKYNGESLTTWEPRGVWQETHRMLAGLDTTHVANVHILANLEPFRYGATEFIRKSVLAMRDRLNAGGLHLYPLTYWNWPHSPDKAREPLHQVDRDWIWFEAWARYAWEPDVDPAADREYWIDRLASIYGDRSAAGSILDAYNAAGEVAPRLLRRFGITEGNRQTLALGMTLEQLVDPEKARPYPELWKSHSPEGERLQEYVEREWAGQPHEGETPPQIIREAREFAAAAVQAIEAAAPRVSRNLEEFARLRNDMRCIRAMAENYGAKVEAAMAELRYRRGGDVRDLEKAQERLAASLGHFRELARLTADTYDFANSMQTSQRRIPVTGGVDGQPANYHWTQLLPAYESELADFQARVASIKAGDAPSAIVAYIAPLSAAPFRLVGNGAETYRVEVGASPFTDRPWRIAKLHPALAGLTGIRFAHDNAAAGGELPVEFETDAPVRVLVGYVQSPDSAWRQPPDLETDALAAGRAGAIEPLLRDALRVSQLPAIDLYAVSYPGGRHRLELRGRGSVVVLGVVGNRR